jgi:hypothetical protein
VPPRLTGLLLAALLTGPGAARGDALEQAFDQPPREARLRAYWWWLNGCVTREAITRDLEEMKDKGFGGALICDADGSAQDGNARAPHGPTFLSPAWRELYRHTLREADRLGLEMSLNIQSGWNLGGPMVTPNDAAKKLVWSENIVNGPNPTPARLSQAKARDGYYRDLFVVAFPLAAAPPPPALAASSAQEDHAPALAADANADTFWVSGSIEPGEGPTPQKPQWLELTYAAPVPVAGCRIRGRPGYGPRRGEIQCAPDGRTFATVARFESRSNLAAVTFAPVTARAVRVVLHGADDPRFPESPRNVQVSEVEVLGPPTAPAARLPIRNWQEKALHKTLHFSAPDTTPLLTDHPVSPGEEDCTPAAVLDLTSRLQADGTLAWDAPPGRWQVLRFGCTIGDHSRVSTCSEGWEGYALDPLDRGAFRRYWDAVVEPLIADAGPLAGTALRYLHTDSWEVEAINWTPTLREEFKKRRGYDLLPWLPVLAGRIVGDRRASNGFLHDFRKTIGDLAVDNHFRPFKEWASQHRLLIHPESGGPHAVPIDAQRCLGINDAPMSEFWAWSWRHRVGDPARYFVKQPASAAHTMGRRLVLAEGFTTIGPHWQETLWDNLKPSFDQACTEGLNLLVWHAFVCSPAEQGLPGVQYFAGTHLNPNVTWWSRSAPFFAYLNRCQALLQQGHFVADVCHYYGDHVPNFAQLKASDPARVLPGYDYDVIAEEALLARAAVRDGRLVLPDGMSYRMLSLPDQRAISLPVLRKLRQLVEEGLTLVGPRPTEATGLAGQPAADQEVRALAAQLWGEPSGLHSVGKGRVSSAPAARELLRADQVPPDFSWQGDDGANLHYIHRATPEADIYFVANRTNQSTRFEARFRVQGRQPELWDPLTGLRRPASHFEQDASLTRVPMELPPYGSMFVVFRAPLVRPSVTGSPFIEWSDALALTNAWRVRFDPAAGGPESATFTQLTNWKDHPDARIRYYAGTATYECEFACALPPGKRYALDLGRLRELAEVRLNGQPLGIVWTPPFRVDATGALRAGSNRLEVDVVNFWPNRLIGDQFLPEAERRTRTNIRKLTRETALMDAGLLGPVRLLQTIAP